MILEVPVETLDEARAAVDAGADRLELCASLEVGGLTPSEETLVKVVEWATVPVMVMIRPRGGDFVYDAADVDAMELAIDLAHVLDADGVVFGALRQDGSIDVELCRRVTRPAVAMDCVFHRAFDCVPDRQTALDQLIEQGFDRILTSGGAATAADATGIETLARLIDSAAGRIDILPGGGIRPDNVASIIRGTGCTSIHSSCRVPTTGGSRLDPALVAELRRIIDRTA